MGKLNMGNYQRKYINDVGNIEVNLPSLFWVRYGFLQDIILKVPFYQLQQGVELKSKYISWEKSINGNSINGLVMRAKRTVWHVMGEVFFYRTCIFLT